MKSIRQTKSELANAKLTIERQKEVNRRLRARLKVNVAKAKAHYAEAVELRYQLRQLSSKTIKDLNQ